MKNYRYLIFFVILFKVITLSANDQDKNPELLFVNKFNALNSRVDRLVAKNEKLNSIDNKEYDPFNYAGFFVTGDYLYWSLSQNTNYVGRGGLYPGVVNSIDFGSHYGYRAGAGARVSKNSLFVAEYTYFNHSKKDTTLGNSNVIVNNAIFENSNLIPIYINQDDHFFAVYKDSKGYETRNLIEKVEASLGLDYRIIDCTGKTQTSFSKFFDLTYHYGFRLAQIEENLYLNHYGTFVNNETATSTLEKSDSLVKLKEKWKYECIGPKGGIGGDLHLFNNCDQALSIKTSITCSLLVGRMKTTYSSKGSLQSPNSISIQKVKEGFDNVYSDNGSDSLNVVKPNIEALAGLEYECKVWQRTILQIFGGYELSYWVNLAQFSKRGNSGSRQIWYKEDDSIKDHPLSLETQDDFQSLALHGLTARLTLKF